MVRNAGGNSDFVFFFYKSAGDLSPQPVDFFRHEINFLGKGRHTREIVALSFREKSHPFQARVWYTLSVKRRFFKRWYLAQSFSQKKA